MRADLGVKEEGLHRGVQLQAGRAGPTSSAWLVPRLLQHGGLLLMLGLLASTGLRPLHAGWWWWCSCRLRMVEGVCEEAR